MKNKWRILKILVTVIIFGFLLSFSLNRFNNKSMENISVNMEYPANTEKVYFIDEKNVKDFIMSKNPSKKIGDLDIPSLEKEVTKFPSVDSANVYLNLNGNLIVDIVQRIPVFRINKNGENFYVDSDAEEFPISKHYSHPTMLVVGNVKRDEYKNLIELVKKINQDDFSKNYFIGISKSGNDYNLLTSEGNFKVEIGDLDNIDFKIKGFKTFAEKFLVFQDQNKYSKVSVKYNNQIVTTLQSGFKENDSIIAASKRELEKKPKSIDNNTTPKDKEVKKDDKKSKDKNTNQLDKKKTKI